MHIFSWHLILCRCCVQLHVSFKDLTFPAWVLSPVPSEAAQSLCWSRQRCGVLTPLKETFNRDHLRLKTRFLRESWQDGIWLCIIAIRSITLLLLAYLPSASHPLQSPHSASWGQLPNKLLCLTPCQELCFREMQQMFLCSLTSLHLSLISIQPERIF